MFKYKNFVLIALMLFFLLFSFYPTLYEVSQSERLVQKNRTFVLDHNYYWPDFNLYLSKIRQGYENRYLAVEKYTSEPHEGSLIQIFYLGLGKLGNVLNINPNASYQLGRIVLSPLLLILTSILIASYFKNALWQILAFLVTITSGSFPRLSMQNGKLVLDRYMDWWSNIDSLIRITFIPHILFGQVVSLFLLYKLAIGHSLEKMPSGAKFFFYVILANLTGLVFPPNLLTLLGVLLLLSLIDLVKHKSKSSLLNSLLFTVFSLPTLIYLFVVTKQVPWSTLVEFHQTHPMMVPLDQYVLGTGPVMILGFLGSIMAVINKKKQYYPLILWLVVTFLFASLFSVVREQSPLRFTQTGLFIPLGILATYFFYRVSKNLKAGIFFTIIFIYLVLNLVIMHDSLDWQLTFINQRIKADFPAVPFPPQTMYPLTPWMDAIVWLSRNSSREDVVLAEMTAGNFIPAYSGNFVYFGQSNTVDFDRKAGEVDRFFKGAMSESQAQIFLKNGRIKYIFVGPQEAEKLQGKKLEGIYPFLKTTHSNSIVTIYK